RFRHAANSAAVGRDPRVWFDRVRPGLLLYGIVPPPLASSVPLAPVLSLARQVTARKGMRVGEVTGYGARLNANRPAPIATDAADARRAAAGACSVAGGSARAKLLIKATKALSSATGRQSI